MKSLSVYIKNKRYSKVSSLKLLSCGGFRRTSGRSKRGVILVRHRGGGVFVRRRCVDLYRGLWNVKGVVVGVEYVGYRYPLVVCISYFIGVLCYISLIKGLRLGSTIIAGGFTPKKIGDSSLLIKMPVNKHICFVGKHVNSFAIFSRAASTYSKIIRKKKFIYYIKIKTGAVIKVSPFAIATLGVVYKSSFILNNSHNKNAGVSRRLGFRPKVRGVAMNPVDHPHGGGEGKKSAKVSPKNIWGFIFKNKATSLKIK